MQTIKRLAAVLACIGLLQPPLYANPRRVVAVCHKNVVAANVVQVPYAVAVPVGVTVAQVAGAHYQYAAGGSAGNAELAQAILMLSEEVRSLKQQLGPQAQRQQQTMLALHCAACHDPNGANPKKDAIAALDLSKQLTAEDFGRAHEAVATGVMPPGRPLDPQNGGKMLRELMQFTMEAIKAEREPAPPQRHSEPQRHDDAPPPAPREPEAVKEK